jgi:8-oxo-dGTP pyrophosphatase MutT (NUDIX family)
MSTSPHAADDALQQLFSAVSEHKAIDERERLSLQKFMTVIPTLLNPCSEHADPQHITASAIVVSATYGTDRVVLHKHKRLGLWLQPGGHIDEGELVADAAVREVREETGLVVQHVHGEPLLIHVDVHPGPRGHTHFDVRYLLVAPDEDPHPGAGESPDAAWFLFDDALAVADEALEGALRAARAVG